MRVFGFATAAAQGRVARRDLYAVGQRLADVGRFLDRDAVSRGDVTGVPLMLRICAHDMLNLAAATPPTARALDMEHAAAHETEHLGLTNPPGTRYR